MTTSVSNCLPLPKSDYNRLPMPTSVYQLWSPVDVDIGRGETSLRGILKLYRPSPMALNTGQWYVKHFLNFSVKVVHIVHGH